MTLLYDSDNPDSIPSGVWAAGYIDGYAALAWTTRGWARFPNAKRIAVFGQTNDGDCLDVERGDATPSEAPQWVQWRRAAGVLQPWVYCNRSNRSQVEAALAAAGILSDQVALWVATLDGTQTVPAGPYPVAAVQYANSLSSGGHYDLSLVNETFGPGGGTIGGDDMTPEEHAWLAVAARAVLPPRPASMGDPLSPGHSDGEFLTIYATSSQDAFIAAYGQDGWNYTSALYHGKPVVPASGGGAESPELTTITLSIPSVPGTATGKLTP